MRHRVLVAISHPAVAGGVMDVLRLDPRFEAIRVLPEEALARDGEWHPALVLADAAAARRLRPIASKVVVAAAGDGASARAVARQIGAAGWIPVDEVDAQLTRFLARDSRDSRALGRAAVLVVALLSVAAIAASVALVWAALAP